MWRLRLDAWAIREIVPFTLVGGEVWTVPMVDPQRTTEPVVVSIADNTN